MYQQTIDIADALRHGLKKFQANHARAMKGEEDDDTYYDDTLVYPGTYYNARAEPNAQNTTESSISSEDIAKLHIQPSSHRDSTVYESLDMDSTRAPETLDLVYQHYTCFDDIPCVISDKLKHLNVDCNGFKDFPHEIISQCKNLETLSMNAQLVQEKRASLPGSRGLSEIPESISKLLRLKQLCLRENAIKEIPTSFSALKLTNLDLRCNDLHVFPPPICQVKTLQTLYLSGNYIRSIPADISNLQNLVELRLGNNRLEEIHTSVGNLAKLQTLSIRYNNIWCLPRNFKDLEKLELVLEENPLEYPPTDVCKKGFVEIKKYLVDNPRPKSRVQTGAGMEGNVDVRRRGQNFEEMDKAVDVKPSDTLEISGQGIKSLSKVVPLEHQNIKVIKASNNPLQDFIPDKTLFPNLHKLIIDNCNFNFTDDLCRHIGDGRDNVQLLSIQNQRDTKSNSEYPVLNTLPKNLQFLSQLTELYLCGNNLSKIGDEFDCLENLLILDLSKNKIAQIEPDMFKSLTKLEYLSLSVNNLEEIPSEIGNLKSLQVLRISHNKLTFIPDSVCDLVNLHMLSLRSNCLQYLPAELYKLKKLLGGEEYIIEHLNLRFASELTLGGNDSLEFPSDAQKMPTEVLFSTMARMPPAARQKRIDKVKQKMTRKSLTLDEQIPAEHFTYLSDQVLLYVAKNIHADVTYQLGIFLHFSSPAVSHIQNSSQDSVSFGHKLLSLWRNQHIKKGEVVLCQDLLKALETLQMNSVRADLEKHWRLGSRD